MSLSGEFDSGSEVHDALKNEPDGLHAELAVAFAAEEALFITPLVFLGKLAVLIPLPRKYRHRYHGFLTPNAALRQAVTAYAGLPIGAEAALKRTSPGAAGLIGSRC